MKGVNMKKLLLIMSISLLSACAKKVVPLEEVVPHHIVCDQSDPVSCGKVLKETCPNGGEIHDVKQVVMVVFSCNDE